MPRQILVLAVCNLTFELLNSISIQFNSKHTTLKTSNTNTYNNKSYGTNEIQLRNMF